MNEEKLAFLQTGYPDLCRQLNAQAPAKWGKMNAQQMLEHVTDFFKVSTEKIIFPLVTPEEHLPKFKAFLLSDKEFRENTKAPAEIVPDEPVALRNNTIGEAAVELSTAIDDFIEYFKSQPGKKTLHPTFGQLGYEEWVLLHYKHVTHHAKQFGMI